MDAVNFNILRRGESRQSNYRLLDEPVKLETRFFLPWARPDGDGWVEDDGVRTTPVVETTEEAIKKREVRMRLGRKQRAARVVRPVEIIKVESACKPAPREVVEARLAGGDATAERIAFLEARIRELTTEVRKPLEERRRLETGIRAFEELFNSKGQTR